MKNALRVIQAAGKLSSVKQVDSVFRDSLTNTAKSMVEVLVNDQDWSYTVALYPSTRYLRRRTSVGGRPKRLCQKPSGDTISLVSD